MKLIGCILLALILAIMVSCQFGFEQYCQQPDGLVHRLVGSFMLAAEVAVVIGLGLAAMGCLTGNMRWFMPPKGDDEE